MPSLLDALSDSENTIDLQDENLITPIHEFLEINPEKRLITIPESEQLFGVYGENKVEIKYFKCPRIILNDIDLYECYIFINYISASGKIGYIQADTVVLDETENYIIFTWELTRNVFDENIDADIYFSISAKQYLEDKEPVFFTRKAKGNLYETVYAEEQITEQYADIILQLLAEMDGVKQIVTPEAINVQKVDCVVDVESDSIGIIDIGCLPSNFGVGDYIIDSEETIWKITSIDSNAIVKLTTDDISQVTKNTIKIGKLSQTVNNKVTNPTTATVGQILAVKAVDENGKPTEFETLDNTAKGVMTANAKALFGTLLYATVYDKDVLADPKTVIDSFLAELDKTVSPDDSDTPVEPEEPDTPVTTYTVTYNLASVTSSNTATTVTEGASYTTVLSSDSTIDKVVVKMGGVDITETAYNSTSKTITIAEITGNIEITASIADSSLLYTLRDASFNGQTAVDTGVALFDKPKDFTILLDFEDYDDQGKTPVIGIYDETNTLDSQKYFIVKGDYIDKNLETQKSRMLITVGDGTNSWSEYSDYSDSYNNISGAFKIAITYDSVSGKYMKYTYNVNSDKRLDGLFVYNLRATIENTLSLGFASSRGYCNFTLNECSIYNRVLSEDEINAWMQ